LYKLLPVSLLLIYVHKYIISIYLGWSREQGRYIRGAVESNRGAEESRNQIVLAIAISLFFALPFAAVALASTFLG